MTTKTFRIGELFEIKTPKRKFNAIDVKFGGKYNYVVRTSNNNGIRGKITEDEQYLNEGNTISFGQDTATIFYQKEPYFTGDKIKVMKPFGFKLTETIACYLLTVMRKAFSGFSWGTSSFNENVLRNVEIILPVTVTGAIDFNYMARRIAELEARRIAELEAYFKVTGLDDYELTSEDEEILAKDVCFKEFQITDIFTVKNTHCILASEMTPNSGRIPYVTAGEGNNSVQTYISYNQDFLDKGNCIFIGGKTMTFSYQESDFISNDSHNLALYLKQGKYANKATCLYMIACLRAGIGKLYHWGDSISSKKIQKDVVSLPVDSSGEIDFAYMEKYVRAKEKQTIARVYASRSRAIEATRSVVTTTGN